MQKTALPRVVIAGTNSGCGKTTVTCAILGALQKKGYTPASFKCGPDYIDPMFHQKVIGVKSSNLDSFFYDDSTINTVLCADNSADISVIEGVMGFYDGVAVDSDLHSTYHLAKLTSTPTILVVNCKGAANSITAMVKGFAVHKGDNNIRAVILSNITEHTYKVLKVAIEREFAGGIQVLGYLPRLPDELKFESRHLGLITANEIQDIREKLDKLADIAVETLDISAILTLAGTAPPLAHRGSFAQKMFTGVNIAVAHDNAFCFYYKETFALFEQLGATIKYFSPLTDTHLPTDTHGIYLGGGYPELYKEALSANTTMLADIKAHLANNTPCVAECGGYMYLTKAIEGVPMVGYIDTDCYNNNKLTRFGYVHLTANRDNLLCSSGNGFMGHEFHYYNSGDNGDSYLAEKVSKLSWQAVHTSECLYAGFPHISFLSNTDTAINFIKKCVEHAK